MGALTTLLVLSGFATSAVPASAARPAAPVQTKAPAAPAAPTSPTLTKTGKDTTTGSTTVTSAGHTVAWTSGYQNRNDPTSGTFTDPLTAPNQYVPNSFKAPPNWDKSYSTDGGTTFSATDPGTATNYLRAVCPSAAGTSTACGPNGSAPLSQPPASNAQSGDGFSAVFFGGNVYNVFHHQLTGALQLSCFVEATHQPCPGIPSFGTYVSYVSGSPFGTGPNLYSTASRSVPVIDPASGRLYFPVGFENTATIGFACADLVNNVSCGFVADPNQQTFNNGRFQGSQAATQIQGGEVVGGFYFYLNDYGLGCFNPANGAFCGLAPYTTILPGYTVSNVYALLFSRLYNFDGVHYFFSVPLVQNGNGNAGNAYGCVVPGGAICPGWPTFNVDTNSVSQGAFPILSATGAQTGICFERVAGDGSTGRPPDCFLLNGTPFADPAPAGFDYSYSNAGDALQIGSKLYIPYTAQGTFALVVQCIDFATGNFCAGFTPYIDFRSVQAYTLRLNPATGCITEIGNGGLYDTFLAATGMPCSVTSTVQITPAQFYCDGAAAHTTTYDRVTLENIGPGVDPNTSRITLSGPNGPLPGFNNVTLTQAGYDPATHSINISSISTATAPTLRASITLVTGQGTILPNSQIQLSFIGDPIQFCHQTTVLGSCTATRVNNTSSVAYAPVNPGGTSPVTASASLTDVPNGCPVAGISVVKSVTPNTYTTVGQTLTYSFVVTNTGTIVLAPVTITDAKLGLSNAPCVAALAPAASATCSTTGMHVVTQADIDTGSYSNTVTATGKPPIGPNVSAQSTVTATGPAAAPAISVVKSVTPTSYSGVGQTLTYSFVVTNRGNVTLARVTISDAILGLNNAACVPTLAPGASATCSTTGSHVTTQADVDAGSITNIVTASGTPPTGPPVTAQSTVTAPGPAAAPKIAVVKSVTPTAYTAVGQTLTYSFMVTNTGNVTLTLVTVSDPKLNLTNAACVQTLAPGASATCSTTGTHVTTQADINAGSYTNTVTASGNPPTGPPVTAQSTVTATGPVAGPAISVVKSVTPTSFTAVGQTLTYRFVVTNDGNVTLAPVTINDPKLSLATAACVATLAPKASATCSTTGTHVTTQADINAGSYSNTVTATGTPPQGAPVTGTSTVVATGPAAAPAITVVKSVTPTSFTAVGQTLSYSFVVKNTGNVTLAPVTITDPKLGLTTAACVATLAPGASAICSTSGSHATTQADINAGSYSNTVTATGTPPTGPVVTGVSTATATGPAAAPAISVVKSVTPTSFTAVGQTLTFSFVVTNRGNVTLAPVTVSDAQLNLTNAACVATLAPGASATCSTTGSHVTTQADINAGTYTNTVTAVGTPPTGPVVTAMSTVTATGPAATPAISVVKSVTPTSFTAVGQTLTYTFVVTNSGNVTLAPVTVSDPKLGLTNAACVATLAPGASATCSTTGTHVTTQADINNGSYANTVTASGTPPSGTPVTGTSTVTATGPAGAPAISVVKSVSPTAYTAVGQTLTFSFVVTNRGNVTLAPVTVTDAQLSLTNAACVASLAPGASATCSTTGTHVTTQADINNGSYANTVTATGTPPTGPPVTGMSTVTATGPVAGPAITVVKSVTPTSFTAVGQTLTYGFVVTNGGNVTLAPVTVTDPKLGLTNAACVATLAPGASATCSTTGTHLTTQADINAGSYANTVTASGTPPSGTPVTGVSTVTATGPAAAPAISVVKSVTPTSFTAVGQTLTFSFMVTNTGNVTLAPVTVTDAQLGLTTAPCVATLAPGASATCSTTGTHVTTQADINAGSYANTVTASGTPPTGPAVTGVGTVTVPGPAATPAISVVKSVTPTSFTAVGQTLTFSFVVTNSGNVTLAPVTITDAKLNLNGAACVATLAPGASATCSSTGTHVTTQADINNGSYSNTVTASGTPPTGTPVTGVSTVTATGPASGPGIGLVKSVTPASFTKVGQTLTYSFVVTNTGNVTLAPVTITDATLGLTNAACVATLAPGASATCSTTGSHVTTQADVNNGSFNNTATASGTPPSGPPVTVMSTAQAVGPSAGPAITVVKSVTPAKFTAAGQTLTYSFVVTNTGNVTLAPVTITDAKLGLTDAACVATLAPGASATCSTTGTYVTTQADVATGSVTNTVTATGKTPNGGSSVLGMSTVIATMPPAIVPPVAPPVFVAPPVPTTGAAGSVFTPLLGAVLFSLGALGVLTRRRAYRVSRGGRSRLV